MQKYGLKRTDDGVFIISEHPHGSYYHSSDVDARIAELEKALRGAKLSHLICDDSWYSCPLSDEGCADDSREKSECTCGAQAHNARIDNVLMVK